MLFVILSGVLHVLLLSLCAKTHLLECVSHEKRQLSFNCTRKSFRVISLSVILQTSTLLDCRLFLVINCVTKFFQCQFLVFKISISLAPEQTPIIRAAGCAFLLPREEWRRVGDRFTGGLALIMSAGPLYRPLTGSCSSRSYTFPRAKKRSCLSAINEGLLAS